MITPEDLELDEIAINETEKSSFAVHLKSGPFVADWHDHNKHQLLYAEGGVIHLQTNESFFLLPSRHAVWIPANKTHRVVSRSNELMLRMLYFDVNSDENPPLSNLRVFPINNFAHELICQTCIWNYSLDNTEKVEGVLLRLIRLYIEQWAETPMPLTLPTTNHPKLGPVLDHIRNNLDKELVVSDIADNCAMSKRTLMRLFKNELQITFSTYLRVSRIIEATEVLSQPGANVSHTAFAVGYDSLSAFSTTFKQLVGMRPQEYLKKISQLH